MFVFLLALYSCKSRHRHLLHLHKSLTFFCISGGTAIGGGDPCQTVGPVEGAGAGGQSGARVRRGGGSAGCGNGRGGGGRPVALLNGSE